MRSYYGLFDRHTGAVATPQTDNPIVGYGIDPEGTPNPLHHVLPVNRHDLPDVPKWELRLRRDHLSTEPQSATILVGYTLDCFWFDHAARVIGFDINRDHCSIVVDDEEMACVARALAPAPDIAIFVSDYHNGHIITADGRELPFPETFRFAYLSSHVAKLLCNNNN